MHFRCGRIFNDNFIIASFPDRQCDSKRTLKINQYLEKSVTEFLTDGLCIYIHVYTELVYKSEINQQVLQKSPTLLMIADLQHLMNTYNNYREKDH